MELADIHRLTIHEMNTIIGLEDSLRGSKGAELPSEQSVPQSKWSHPIRTSSKSQHNAISAPSSQSQTSTPIDLEHLTSTTLENMITNALTSSQNEDAGEMLSGQHLNSTITTPQTTKKLLDSSIARKPHGNEQMPNKGGASKHQLEQLASKFEKPNSRLEKPIDKKLPVFETTSPVIELPEEPKLPLSKHKQVNDEPKDRPISLQETTAQPKEPLSQRNERTEIHKEPLEAHKEPVEMHKELPSKRKEPSPKPVVEENQQLTEEDIRKFLSKSQKQRLSSLENWLRDTSQRLNGNATQSETELVEKLKMELIIPNALLGRFSKSIDRPAIDLNPISRLYYQVIDALSRSKSENLLHDKLIRLDKLISLTEPKAREDALDRLSEKRASMVLKQMQDSKVDFRPEIHQLKQAIENSVEAWNEIQPELEASNQHSLTLTRFDEIVERLVKIEIVDTSFEKHYSTYFALKTLYPRLCLLYQKLQKAASNQIIADYITNEMSRPEEHAARAQLEEIALSRALDIQNKIEEVKANVNLGPKWSDLVAYINETDQIRSQTLIALEQQGGSEVVGRCLNSKLFFPEMTRLRGLAPPSTSKPNLVHPALKPISLPTFSIPTVDLESPRKTEFSSRMSGQAEEVKCSNPDQMEEEAVEDNDVQIISTRPSSLEHSLEVSKSMCLLVIDLAFVVRDALQSQKSPKLDNFQKLLNESEGNYYLLVVLAKQSKKFDTDVEKHLLTTPLERLEGILTRMSKEPANIDFFNDLRAHFMALYEQCRAKRPIQVEPIPLSQLKSIADSQIDQSTRLLVDNSSNMSHLLQRFDVLRRQDWRTIVNEGLFFEFDDLEALYKTSGADVPEVNTMLEEYRPLFAEGKKMHMFADPSVKHNLPNLRKLLEKLQIVFKNESNPVYDRVKQMVPELEGYAVKQARLREISIQPLKVMVKPILASYYSTLGFPQLVSIAYDNVKNLIDRKTKGIEELVGSKLELPDAFLEPITKDLTALKKFLTVIEGTGLMENPIRRPSAREWQQLYDFVREEAAGDRRAGLFMGWVIASSVMLRSRKVCLRAARDMFEYSLLICRSHEELRDTHLCRRVTDQYQNALRIKRELDVVVRTARTWQSEKSTNATARKQVINQNFIKLLDKKLKESRICFTQCQKVLKSLLRVSLLQEQDMEQIKSQSANGQKVDKKVLSNFIGRIDSSAVVDFTLNLYIDKLIRSYKDLRAQLKKLEKRSIQDPVTFDQETSKLSNNYQNCMIKDSKLEKFIARYKKHQALCQNYKSVVERQGLPSEEQLTELQNSLTQASSQPFSLPFASMWRRMLLQVWQLRAKNLEQKAADVSCNSHSSSQNSVTLNGLNNAIAEVKEIKKLLQELVSKPAIELAIEADINKSHEEHRDISKRLSNVAQLIDGHRHELDGTLTPARTTNTPGTHSAQILPVTAGSNNKTVALISDNSSVSSLKTPEKVDAHPQQPLSHEGHHIVTNSEGGEFRTPTRAETKVEHDSDRLQRRENNGGDIVIDLTELSDEDLPMTQQWKSNTKSIEPGLVKKIKDNDGGAILRLDDPAPTSQRREDEPQTTNQLFNRLQKVIQDAENMVELPERWINQLLTEMVELKMDYPDRSDQDWEQNFAAFLNKFGSHQTMWNALSKSNFQKDLLVQAVLEKRINHLVLARKSA